MLVCDTFSRSLYRLLPDITLVLQRKSLHESQPSAMLCLSNLTGIRKFLGRLHAPTHLQLLLQVLLCALQRTRIPQPHHCSRCSLQARLRKPADKLPLQLLDSRAHSFPVLWCSDRGRASAAMSVTLQAWAWTPRWHGHLNILPQSASCNPASNIYFNEPWQEQLPLPSHVVGCAETHACSPQCKLPQRS
jgi:hypothetical protein